MKYTFFFLLISFAGFSQSRDIFYQQLNEVRMSYELDTLQRTPRLEADPKVWPIDKEEKRVPNTPKFYGQLEGLNIEIENLVERWMNSPGHRRTLLNPRFTKVGLTFDSLYVYARFE